MTRNKHWVAFVPEAARWPYEVRIFPAVRVPDLPALDEAARAAFGPLYLDVLRRFDGLFGRPAPYIAAWHQAPAADPSRAPACSGPTFRYCRSGAGGKLNTWPARNPGWACGSATSSLKKRQSDCGRHCRESAGHRRGRVHRQRGRRALVAAGHEVTVLDDLSTGHADAVRPGPPSSRARCATAPPRCWPTAPTGCCTSRPGRWSASRSPSPPNTGQATWAARDAAGGDARLGIPTSCSPPPPRSTASRSGRRSPRPPQAPTNPYGASKLTADPRLPISPGSTGCARSPALLQRGRRRLPRRLIGENHAPRPT